MADKRKRWREENRGTKQNKYLAQYGQTSLINTDRQRAEASNHAEHYGIHSYIIYIYIDISNQTNIMANSCSNNNDNNGIDTEEKEATNKPQQVKVD